jgi:hypothetical protein
LTVRRTVRVAGEDVPAPEYFSLCEHGREVAQVVGVDKAREIIRIALERSGNRRPGTGSLYIPKDKSAAGKLASIIGMDAALALIDALPCAILNFTRSYDLRRIRDSQVAQMLREGFGPAQVAEIFGMSKRNILNIAGSHRIEPSRKHSGKPLRVILARGRKVAARRIAAAGLPAHSLRRAAACPIYARALAEVAARHGLRLPEGLGEVGAGTA